REHDRCFAHADIPHTPYAMVRCDRRARLILNAHAARADRVRVLRETLLSSELCATGYKAITFPIASVGRRGRLTRAHGREAENQGCLWRDEDLGVLTCEKRLQ